MAPKRKRGGSSGASSSRNGARRKKRPAPSPSPSPPCRHAPEVIDVDKETWDVRDPELDFFYPEEEYKDAPGKFSIAFHHGGSFFETKEEKKYVGGYLTGISCTHAIATINKNGKDVSDYVSRYYLRSTMSILYENVMYPINGMDNWPKTANVGFELAPPRTKRQRGRPKKLRREEPQVRHHEDESESLRRTFVLRCRRCGQEGHNRRTCTNDPRVDARTEVGQSSQPSEPSEPPTTDGGDRAESSNVFQNQEVLFSMII